MNVRLEASWKALLANEFEKPCFRELADFVRAAYRSTTVYPAPANVFRALDLCPVDRVRVVILGQDPYHGPRQAHGLSFSVAEGVRPPPSLQNIFKELRDDVGIAPPASGDLSKWAAQGVLLLNAALTVEAGKPNSHQDKGWAPFTDAIIRRLAETREGLVFILWGKFAQQKAGFVDPAKHLILASAHPSPYSAANGFFGSKPFSKANAFLTRHGGSPVDWAL